MHGSRSLQGANMHGMQPLWPANYIASNARAFTSNLEAIAAKAGHVKEDVGQILIWGNKSVTPRWIEPPYRSRDLEHIG
jgi:hypothetical protein